jgi:hypothetical protein
MDKEPHFNTEELLKEVAALEEDVPIKTRCQVLREHMAGTNTMYTVSCDAEGRFLPMQCDSRKSPKFPECWCVDEAGNQLPNTGTFRKGSKICLPTPVDAVDVQLGFRGQRHDIYTNGRLQDEVRNTLEKLGAKLRNNLIEVRTYPDVTYVTFEVIGSNKVDVAFHLEELVRAHKLTVGAEGLVADITSSRFSHHLPDSVSGDTDMSDHVIALEHREIVSQSTVSMVTAYQTAIIVLCVASAFVICILVVVIALYRKKAACSTAQSLKTTENTHSILSQAAPICVVALPLNKKAQAHFPTCQK